MDDELRRRLTDRAFLFDDPNAYLAGVDAALRAVAERDGGSGPRGAASHRDAHQGVGVAGIEHVTNRV